MVAGTPCLTCHRPMRPTRARVSEYPGTVPHEGKGRCGTCRKREVYGQGRELTAARIQTMRADTLAWLRSVGRTPGPDHFTWPDPLTERLDLAA
jgi:hypothetical protein